MEQTAIISWTTNETWMLMCFYINKFLLQKLVWGTQNVFYTLHLNQPALPYRPGRDRAWRSVGPILPCCSLSPSYTGRPGWGVGPLWKIPLVLFSNIHGRWSRGGASTWQGGLTPSLCISLPSGPIFLITCMPGDFCYWMLNLVHFTRLVPDIFVCP